MRIFAVGDIHGHDALLGRMLDAIRDDIAGRPKARNVVVFLGDLIDRGPDSAAVVERLRTLADEPFRPVFISGNHEEVLLRILDGDHRLIGDWLRFGGKECAASYGLAAADLRSSNGADSVKRLKAAIPESHQAFLRSFADSFVAGDYLFVHAGIRPGLPIEQQSLSDLRWIRRPFLDCKERHSHMIVHGHSISRDVEFRSGRIGVDTGAYRSGLLSAIVLEATGRRVIQVRQTA